MNPTILQAKIDIVSEILRDFRNTNHSQRNDKTYKDGCEHTENKMVLVIQKKWLDLLDEKHTGLTRYELVVPSVFPKKHKKDEQKTTFAEDIKNGFKIHIFQSDYAKWKSVMDEVRDGKAYVSLVEKEGLEIMRFDNTSTIGIQKVHYSRKKFYLRMVEMSINQLANNDGMIISDFLDFFKCGSCEDKALIHFTDFRY